MISRDEIDRAILELESRDTTFATCEKLAWLYTVRDHIAGDTFPRFTASADDSQSEFCQAACSCDPSALMVILEEHFNIIKALYPREYASIMAKIKSVV